MRIIKSTFQSSYDETFQSRYFSVIRILWLIRCKKVFWSWIMWFVLRNTTRCFPFYCFVINFHSHYSEIILKNSEFKFPVIFSFDNLELNVVLIILFSKFLKKLWIFLKRHKCFFQCIKIWLTKPILCNINLR